MPQSVSFIASASNLFPVASQASVYIFILYKLSSNSSLNDCQSLFFHRSKLKSLTFLPKLLASEADSVLIA